MASEAKPLTAEDEAMTLRVFQNSKRLILAEPHIRRLAALAITLELFIEELKSSGDELHCALADVIDAAGESARATKAALRA